MNTTTTTQSKDMADKSAAQRAAGPRSDSADRADSSPAFKQDVKATDQAPVQPGDEQLAGPRGSTAAAYSTATKAEPDPGMPNQETGTAGFPYETFPGKDVPGALASDVGAGQSEPGGITQAGAPPQPVQTAVAADQDHIRQRLRDGKLSAQDVAYLEKMLDQRGTKARA